MKKLKKQFLAAGLVLALGAAVYLNWSLSGTKNVSRTLGESKYVSATVSTSEKTEKTKKTNAVETALTDKEKSFFSEARTKRDKIQDRVIDEAEDALDMENVSEKEMSEAQSQIAKILKNFTLQDTIETSLKAKGFSDALCYLSDDGCAVTLLKKELTEDTEIVVKAAVKAATDIGFDKITIVTV